MNYFKQALFQMRSQIANTFILGVSSTVLIFTVRHVPYLDAFLLGLGLLAMQSSANLLVVTHAWPKNISFLSKHFVAYIGASLVLLPTYILGGSAFGVLQSPQGINLMLPMAAGLFMISVYFYLLMSHSLRWHLEKNVSLAKAIDLFASASLRNYRKYFNISFYIGVFMALSAWAWGVGFIFTFPFLFYCNHFLYIDMEKKQLIERAQP